MQPVTAIKKTVFGKRLFSARRLAALATTALCLFALTAQAQETSQDNFQEFREKLAAERAAQQATSGNPQAAAPAVAPAILDFPAAASTQPVVPGDPAIAPVIAAPAIVTPSAETPPPQATMDTPALTTTPPVTTSSVIAPEAVVSPLNALNAPGAVVSPLGNPANPLGPAANLPLNGQMMRGPQSQAEIQAALEAETAVLQKKADDQVYESAVKQLMPLQPKQVRKLLGTFQENREAAETPYSTPEPKQLVTTVSLDPSEAPPIIKLSPGNVTTVTILDSTGAPWPIQDVSWAGKFAVTPPESGGHVMRITPQSAHGVGNISIRLVDLIAPVTMTLQTGLEEVYYRFDARIPKAGPLAKTPLIEYGGLKSIAGKDNAITSLLDGTPPTGARKLKVNGPDGRTTAFKINDRIYLRTPLTLLSPGWDSSATSADGINVYTIPKAPVLLLSDNGRMVQTRLADEEVKP